MSAFQNIPARTCVMAFGQQALFGRSVQFEPDLLQAQDRDRRARGDWAHSHASGDVGTAAADTSAARRSVSGGLIRKPGLVLDSADGWPRLALAGACGSEVSGQCGGETFEDIIMA
jgi:hypothetical protein